MPSHEVIVNCVDKEKSYQIWQKAGLNMPRIFIDIALYNKFPVLEKKNKPTPRWSFMD